MSSKPENLEQRANSRHQFCFQTSLSRQDVLSWGFAKPGNLIQAPSTIIPSMYCIMALGGVEGLLQALRGFAASGSEGPSLKPDLETESATFDRTSRCKAQCKAA